MTSAEQPRWSDLDIERYHDGDMPEDAARAFTRDLMADAALRARLDRVRRLDDAARRALLAPAPETQSAGARRTHTIRPFAIAAAIMLAVAAGLVARHLLPTPAAPAETSPMIVEAERQDDSGSEPAHAPRLPGRAVLVMNIERPRTERSDEADSDTSSGAPALAGSHGVTQLDEALRRGDAILAMRLLADENGAAEAESWERIGALLLSADTAREALDMLPPARRIDAMRAWAHRPSLRPIVFTRLAALGADPDTAQLAAELRRELSQIPELRPWLASYALRASP